MLPQQHKPVSRDSAHRLPDPNVSASSGMMTSMVLPANFQVSAGLMRYHSAPGSFLATLIDDDRRNILTHVSGASPDSGFSQILSSDSSAASATHNGGVLHQNQSNPVNKIVVQDHSTSHPKRVSTSVTEDFGKSNQLSVIIENGMESSENNYDESEISLMYQNQGSRSNEQLLSGKLKQTSVLYSDLESCGENLTLSATKNTLSRQTSSPAAVLSRLACSAQRTAENGYVGVMLSGQTSKVGVTSEGMRVNHPANITRQNSSPAELFAHLPMNMNFPHYAGKFNINRSQTPGETLAKCTTDSARLGNQEQGQPYVSAVSGRVWEEGTVIPESYEGLQNESYRKRGKEMEETINPGKEDPRRNVMSTVANHHFGLYKSLSSDLSLEKILEDSVPCRIRAKRGCATHPRSIAERVRRTRISDRIRKLQELVPSMDKQTNTADMLDEAVEYVKFLQKQVQELTEIQSKCTCGARQNEIDKAEQQ